MGCVRTDDVDEDARAQQRGQRHGRMVMPPEEAMEQRIGGIAAEYGGDEPDHAEAGGKQAEAGDLHQEPVWHENINFSRKRR